MFGFANLLASSFKNSIKNPSLVKSQFSTFTQPLWMRVTPPLLALPMKRKKKADPQLEKLRTEKKRKRLWRDIKRLTKLEKQLKPIEEIDIPYKIVDNKELYLRERKPISAEVLDERGELLRAWTSYKTKQHAKDLQLIDRIEYTQHRALQELMQESPELYKKAIEIDESFLPFNAKGTTQTPPFEDYFNPDGEYVDKTRTWDPPKLPDKKQLKKLGIEIIREQKDDWKKEKEKEKEKKREEKAKRKY